MRTEQWTFYDNFSVFGQVEKSLNGRNCFEDIYFKFKKIELVEMQLHNYPAREFIAYCVCRNTELNLKSTTVNGFNFRPLNSLMESCGGG